MSSHLMNRLAIAREDPVIRASIPASTFRSQTQAKQEAQMKMLLAARQAQAKKMSSLPPPGTAVGTSSHPPPQTSLRGPQSSPTHNEQRNHAAQGSVAHRQPPPSQRTRVPMPLSSLASRGQPTSSPVPSSTVARTPPMPFVYRRAAFDIQITDPATNDILILDRGTWVLSAAGPHPVTNLLPVYTTEHDTGKVIVYELPIPEGDMAKFFDMHTLNVVETMAMDQQETQDHHEYHQHTAATADMEEEAAESAWPSS